MYGTLEEFGIGVVRPAASIAALCGQARACHMLSQEPLGEPPYNFIGTGCRSSGAHRPGLSLHIWPESTQLYQRMPYAPKRISVPIVGWQLPMQSSNWARPAHGDTCTRPAPQGANTSATADDKCAAGC